MCEENEIPLNKRTEIKTCTINVD